MKRLRKMPSEDLEDMFFEMCLKSKSGCNIVVGDKYHNVYVNSRGEYVTNEFKLDYELTEDEFKKFKK
jgi:hypothetical protein|tara:strand:+ start:114 stop:317 length:204 start_codon:yes stop_codon:yes gene_type:complete